MYKIFKVTVTHEQASALFMEQKDPSRTWPQYVLYVAHLARVSESSEHRIIDNIIKHAAPKNKHMMLIRLDPNRFDYVAHAQELIAWGQELEDDRKKAKYLGRDVIAAVGELRKIEPRGATGHTKRDHPNQLTHEGGRVSSTTKNTVCPGRRNQYGLWG
ncbi:hypothetical protein CCR75_006138 [Bremia lactucae]|uniref:Uncharacterized protein n=1 Tax=Bremia lactucae TaxID=4779 RepID=A0A976FFE4_BRELC|nr:hypothetical protein CCR75_006138 [Bremia lactucae]